MRVQSINNNFQNSKQKQTSFQGTVVSVFYPGRTLDEMCSSDTLQREVQQLIPKPQAPITGAGRINLGEVMFYYYSKIEDALNADKILREKGAEVFPIKNNIDLKNMTEYEHNFWDAFTYEPTFQGGE